MDAERFDALTRALSAARTRRGFARILASGGLAAALGGLGASEVAAACKAPGTRCRKDGECCSRRCRKRRGRRTGKCRACGTGTTFCPERQACAAGNVSDCCTDNDCGSGRHCCGGLCATCCADSHCVLAGTGGKCCGQCNVDCCLDRDCNGRHCSGGKCGIEPTCDLVGTECAPDGPNATCCSGDCIDGECGLSDADEPCIGNSSCGNGLVCRGFVCATPA